MNIIHQRLLALSTLLLGLKLYVPVYQQMYSKSQEFLANPCEQYSRIESSESELFWGDDFSEDWQNSNQPPHDLAKGAEVIFISGYEPDRQLDSGRVEINLDRPHQKVLLVLSSYEKVNWEVSASPETQVVGILYSSHNASTLVTNNLPTEVFAVELPYTYEAASQNFVTALESLNYWFDITKVDGFWGQYYLPNEIKINQVNLSDPVLTLEGYPIEKSDHNSQFIFYDDDYTPFTLTTQEINNHSPKLKSVIGQRDVAIAPDGKTYELTATGIQVSDRVSGQQEIYPLPDSFPKLSWATDLAYDSKRNLVAVVSYGGEGYFYRFDAYHRRWLDVKSLNNIDLQSLTYDPIFDRYIAWSESFVGDEGNLWFISSNGELQFSENISDRLKEYHRLYNRASESAPPVEIVANGNDIALVARHNPQRKFDVVSPIAAIWHYDRYSNTVRLSYKQSR